MARSSRPTRSGSRRVETNGALGLLDQHRDRAIVRAAREAITNRADEPFGDELGCKKPVRQNDHVDISPSSNDSFPTAMHIAAGPRIAHDLAPALSERNRARRAEEKTFAKIVKIGRASVRNTWLNNMLATMSSWRHWKPNRTSLPKRKWRSIG